jgi:hypothetical protein
VDPGYAPFEVLDRDHVDQLRAERRDLRAQSAVTYPSIKLPLMMRDSSQWAERSPNSGAAGEILRNAPSPPHAARDKQFRHTNRLVKAYVNTGDPVLARFADRS